MSKNLDPEKFHVIKNIDLKLLYLMGGLFLVVLLAFSAFYYNFALHRPAQTTRTITTEILPGESLVDISSHLYSQGLINSQGLFLFYVTATNQASNIQAGVYTIPAGTSLKDLVILLQEGTKDVRLTFLEGWRVEQFALEASSKLVNVVYSDFVLQAFPLEGYLFPDTYFVSYDISTEELISLLTKTFSEKTEILFKGRSDLVSDLTDVELVVLASLLEREINNSTDAPVVAGVLLSRYRLGMPLGVDATTQYYIPFLREGCSEREWPRCFSYEEARDAVWWPTDITLEDLAYDSAYNTRRNVGLPPAPISSISLRSLEAALNPAETSYLYYLNDSSGATHFAETLNEHEANIIRYLR